MLETFKLVLNDIEQSTHREVEILAKGLTFLVRFDIFGQAIDVSPSGRTMDVILNTLKVLPDAKVIEISDDEFDI
jgi:hypothetical protein